MTPPTVLLERSFLVALIDPNDGAHALVRERYIDLVGRYRAHEIRLRARHDHLDEIGPDQRSTLLAPVERISVAAQFRRQAARLTLPFEATDDLRVTLVVMRRESIDRIATLDPVFEGIDVTIE